MVNEVLDELLLGLEKKEFVVYFQPKVEIATGSVVGAEALVRRKQQGREILELPDAFLSKYEQHSVISHLDFFVVETVCSFLRSFGVDYPKIPISVNLSYITLLEHTVVDTITAICDKYDIDPQFLVLEMTERAELLDEDASTQLVDKFKAHNFKLSLDDFGSAYSNMITLAQVEFDEVKLDKSLIEHLESSNKSKIIVQSILRMCNDLEPTKMLAEGVEGEAQAALLQEYGCSYAQGYYYSPPLPQDKFFKKYVEPTR